MAITPSSAIMLVALAAILPGECRAEGPNAANPYEYDGPRSACPARWYNECRNGYHRYDSRSAGAFRCRIQCRGHFWQYSAWSAWDAACGPGRRTRTGTCDPGRGGICLNQLHTVETRVQPCSCPVSQLANAVASSTSVDWSSGASYYCNVGYAGIDGSYRPTYASSICTVNAVAVTGSGALCVAVPACGTGRYQTAASSGVAARTCATCSLCGNNEFIGTQCAGATNTACETCEYRCPAGQYAATLCDGSASAHPAAADYCSPCPSNTYLETETVNQLTCTTQPSPCVAGQHESVLATASSRRVCDECSCPFGTFLSAGCDGGPAPPVCTPCETCATSSDGQFATPGSCRGRSDTVCVNHDVCDAGQYEAVPGTSTSQPVCALCSSCGTSQYIEVPCSGPTDTGCSTTAVCSPGGAGGPAREYVLTQPTPTSDRRCAVCSSCRSGSYQNESCTATTDTVCALCPPGSACDGVTRERCPPGYHQGTAVQTECLACTGPMLYSAWYSQYICQTVTPGHYSLPEQLAGNTDVATGQQICPAGSKCVGGLREACPIHTHQSSLGASICEPCSPGTNTTTPGQANCAPDCAPGCSLADLADTVCHPRCNVEVCGWDGNVCAPTVAPSTVPSAAPTSAPTSPTSSPTPEPSLHPTAPTKAPSTEEPTPAPATPASSASSDGGDDGVSAAAIVVPVVLVLLLACMLGVIYVRRTDAQQQKDKLAADQHIDGARSQGHANPMYSIPTDTGGSIQIPTLFLAGTDPNSTGTDSGKHTYNHLGDSTYGVASDVAIGPDLYDTVENKANDGENKGYLDVGESSASAEDGVAAARAEVLCFHPVEREECELKLNQAVLGGGSWFMTRAKAGATVLSYVIEKPEAARYVNIEGATERGVQHRKIVQNASDGSFETTQSGEQLSLGLTLPSAVSKLVEMLEIRFACKVNGLRVVQPVVAMPITMQDTYEAGEVGAAAVSATLPMEVAAGDELYYDGGKDKVRAGFTVDAASGSAPATPVAPSEAAPRKKSRPGPIAFGVEASIKPSPVTYVEATLDMPTTPAGGRDMEEPPMTPLACGANIGSAVL